MRDFPLHPRLMLVLAGTVGLAAAGACSSDGSVSAIDVAIDAGPVALRRLTSAQYERSIRDVLGDHIIVPSRIDPDDRRDGLLAVGASFAGVTPSGLEKYEAAAAEIAQQALDPEHRAALVPCEPTSETVADDECATATIVQVGRRLFRRSLTPEETDARIAIAREAATALNDFYAGLELALMSLLVSPEFLFRVEEAEPDPSDPSRMRLTSISMAARLSYLLWDTTPDDTLLDAGESGSLVDDSALAREIERLLASEKLDTGLRTLFSDLYDFRQFDDGLVRKDGALYPAYTQPMIEDAKEQTLRTIVDHLIADEDYRELFTTRSSFMTRRLGVIYQLPVPTPTGWEPYLFPEESRRAGLLGHVSLNALHSHPGRSSPTLRGKFVREVLLCQDVPTPPADIDFSIVEDTSGPLQTARDRLTAHVANDTCAGCHALTDPIGLALEQYDAIGMSRERENGVLIDTSGQLDGMEYDDAVGLGQALSEHPSLGPCFVLSLYRSAVGRQATIGEEPLITALEERFADSGYRVTRLLRDVLMSDGFRTASGPRELDNTESSP